MRLSDIVGEKLAAIIHSPASTYTSSAVSASSGVAALIDHNVIFIIGTFGGLFFAFLTYRSRKRRDDEMSVLDKQRTEQHRKMTDALVEYLAKNSDSLKDIDKAPEVVREITDTIRRETIIPEVDRRNDQR